MSGGAIADLLAPGERLVELGWGYGFPGACDARSGAWLFACTADDPQAALDAARDEWLDRIRHEVLEGYDHPFGTSPNWGDFMLDGGEELAIHGLRPLNIGFALSLTSVDHDEVLGTI